MTNLSKPNIKIGILLAVGVLAVLLIILSETSEKKSKTKSNPSSSTPIGYDYEKELETRLESIISQIDGAGNVKVLVKTQGGEENRFALDSNFSTGTDGDKKSESKYVIINGENGEQGVLLNKNYPAVQGVIIVCQGGNDSRLKNEIINAVSALLGISKACVSVSKMK